jgi:hypothetical protein
LEANQGAQLRLGAQNLASENGLTCHTIP